MTERTAISPMGIPWDELTFQLYPTKSMYLAKWTENTGWDSGSVLPFQNLSLSPAAAVLHYAQGIFEGLKAQRTKNNEIVLFRPDQNASRFAESAIRICMPPVPETQFIEAVRQLVHENTEYIPPYGKGSLYVRPALWGTSPMLGIQPAKEYTFCVFTSPVGPYFKTGMKPIRLIVSEDEHRAAPKGVGHVKYIGNYARGLLPAKLAKEKGYHACLYLDAKEEKYVDEVGVANFFCVKDDVLYTPELGTILPGITRDSVLKIAEKHLKMKVKESKVPILDVLNADECFCTGTAAVITPIASIHYQNKEATYCQGNVGPVSQKLYDLLLGIQLKEHSDDFNWVVTL